MSSPTSTAGFVPLAANNVCSRPSSAISRSPPTRRDHPDYRRALPRPPGRDNRRVGRSRVIGNAQPDVRSRLAGSARKECGDDVGGVPVEALSAPVIPHRGARVGTRGGLLDVA